MRHDYTTLQDPDTDELVYVLGRQLADYSLPINEQVAVVRDWLKDNYPRSYEYVMKWFPKIAYAENWTDENIKDEWHISAMQYLNEIDEVAWYFEGLDTPYEIIDTIWKDDE